MGKIMSVDSNYFRNLWKTQFLLFPRRRESRI